MARIYLGKEETARSISSYMGNTCGELVNPNICNQETLQDIADLLGTPDDAASADESSTIIAMAKYIQDYLTKGVSEKIVSPIAINCSYTKTTINGKGIIFGAVRNTYLKYIKIDGEVYSPTISDPSGTGFIAVLDGIPFETSVQITSSLTYTDVSNYPLVVMLY